MMNKKEEETVKVKVEETLIEQEHVAKLLGVQVDDEMSWKEQENGKGQVISSLNQCTHLIKRLRNPINPEKLKCLWTSKLRNGLQLWARVRTENTYAKKTIVAEIPKAKNKLLKVLERKRISDRIPISEMLENQLAAQFKLLEVWKAKNRENYPVKMDFRAAN